MRLSNEQGSESKWNRTRHFNKDEKIDNQQKGKAEWPHEFSPPFSFGPHDTLLGGYAAVWGPIYQGGKGG